MCKKSVCSFHLVNADKIECFVCKKEECKKLYDQQELAKRRRLLEENEDGNSEDCSTKGCDQVCGGDGDECCMCNHIVCEGCSEPFKGRAQNEEGEPLTFCSARCFAFSNNHNHWYIASYLYFLQPQH